MKRKSLTNLMVLGLTLIVVFALHFAVLGEETMYTNHFELEGQWPDYGIGDPYVLRYNGRYYLYPSTKDGFEGVRVFISEDLVNWTYGGYATKDPITTGAYAPEVIYSNGYFYMYTSPAGQGHYVLQSTSPTGPFEVKTDNLGLTIDGNVFIDDDGQWYFTHAGDRGIVGREMEDPFTPSLAGKTLNTYLGHWTEGSTIFKHNGIYYLTYAGNHVFSEGYRINYAVAKDHPLGDYFVPSNNPIVINAGEGLTGLGHNSIVRGPNLDEYYIIYHNLEGRSQAGPPLRKMNIDRLVFNGVKMSVLGPTDFPQPAPELPDFYTWVDEDGWDNWKYETGQLGTLALAPLVSESAFTAEYNLCLEEGMDAEQYGVIFAYKDSNNFSGVEIDVREGLISLFKLENGTKSILDQTPQMPNWDLSSLHTIRVEKNAGQIRVFKDNLLILMGTGPLSGGKIGYYFSKNKPTISFTALSNQVAGSSYKQVAKPLPGTFEAVHYRENTENLAMVTGEEESYALKLEANQGVSYTINVRDRALYAVDLTTSAVSGGQIKLSAGNKVLGEFSLEPNNSHGWAQTRLAIIELEEGMEELTLTQVSGASEISVIHVYQVPREPFSFHHSLTTSLGDVWKNYGTWNWMIGDKGAYVPPNDDNFLLTGSPTWDDYIVEVDLEMGGLERLGNFGLMFRITNPSYHPHQVVDAAMGYYVAVSPRQITLNKLNYGTEILAIERINLEAGRQYNLKVVTVGNVIEVYWDDNEEPLITFVDPKAFMHGQVGIRSSKMTAYFKNFSVESLDSTK